MLQVSDVARRVDGIVEARHRRLPRVCAELERWRSIDDQVVALGASMVELRRSPNAPPEVAGLPRLPIEELRRDVAEVVDRLRAVEARFSRETVNIGVSGMARVGKSTLLQSISGLTEEEVPTGEGAPVTAVRSRIFHSTTHRRATLRLHSYRTFVHDVLQPFHQALGLPEPPPTLTEFRSWTYPERRRQPEGTPYGEDLLLDRLRTAHEALSSYEAELTGEERVVELAGLRRFVAYPSPDEGQGTGRAPHTYLAVRDVRIECPFPHAQVERLGVIDLPGLGEVTAGAEMRHVAGLRDEVDVVLLVKRPVSTEAFWKAPDVRVVDLLDEARGFVSRRDFVFVVINDDGTEPGLVKSLEDDIRERANQGEEGRHFAVLKADAASPDNVFERVLLRVLTHLAVRLPDMDEAVFQGTRDLLGPTANRVATLVADAEEALRSVRSSSGAVAEDLEVRTQALLKKVASSLSGLVEDLAARARAGDEDPAYVESVERTYERARRWIEEGLGKGRDEWCRNALLSMRLMGGCAGFAEEELNRVRVMIAKHFAHLDDFFSDRQEQVWGETAALLAEQMGALLDNRSGKEALQHLASLLHEASDPCPTLEVAVRELLDLRLDYRTQLHPRVRFELDGLSLEREHPITHERMAMIRYVPVTQAGAEDLYRQVTDLAEQAAHEVMKALLVEAVTPIRVLFAATEQFLDALVRSEESVTEFRRLARSYRDEIWPGVYQGIDETNARFAAVRRATGALTASLAGTGEGAE